MDGEEYPFDEMFECLGIIFDIIEYEKDIKESNPLSELIDLYKSDKNFETLFEVQIFEAVYNKFKREFDKREKMGYEDEQGNSETIDYTNKTKENQTIKITIIFNKYFSYYHRIY